MGCIHQRSVLVWSENTSHPHLLLPPSPTLPPCPSKLLETFMGLDQRTGAGTNPRIPCVVSKSDRDHGTATTDNRNLGLTPAVTISRSNLSLSLYPILEFSVPATAGRPLCICWFSTHHLTLKQTADDPFRLD